MLDTRLSGLTAGFLQFQHAQRQQQQLLQQQQQQQQQLHHQLRNPGLVFPPTALGQLKPIFPGTVVPGGSHLNSSSVAASHPLLRLPIQPVPVSAAGVSVPPPPPSAVAQGSLSPDAAAAALRFRANLTPSPGPGKFLCLFMAIRAILPTLNNA